MKATIVNNVENTTKVMDLSDNISSVAALKQAIGVSDGRIFEGVTHTDLNSDNAPLPQLPEEKKERGYVFFVSPAQNKTKNGAYTRTECYTFIKSHGLGEKIKDVFGRNFTQVSTDALNRIINEFNTSSMPDAPATPSPSHVSTQSHTPSTASYVTFEPSVDANITEKDLWKAFVNAVCPVEQVERFNAMVDKVFPNPYSIQDLANMRK